MNNDRGFIGNQCQMLSKEVYCCNQLCLENDHDKKQFSIECRGTALRRSVIGPENSRHSLNQSYAKLKPFFPFSRALGSLVVSTLSSGYFPFF